MREIILIFNIIKEILINNLCKNIQIAKKFNKIFFNLKINLG